MARNVSLFALPIYWLLVMGTRGFSIFYLRPYNKPSSSSSAAGGDGELIDQASPHSSATAERLAARVPPEALATYERIHAAHRNGVENMAFYFSAVIVANVARLGALELSLCAWLFVAVRFAYVLAYVNFSRKPLSYLRTATFGLGVFLCWWLMLRGAVFVLYDYREKH